MKIATCLALSFVVFLAFSSAFAILSANYVDGIYATRVARGGDGALGDLVGAWVVASIAFGLFCSAFFI